jgi:hypothetical protein
MLTRLLIGAVALWTLTVAGALQHPFDHLLIPVAEARQNPATIMCEPPVV